MSYDETSSIESEEHLDYSIMEQDTTILENQLQNALILNVCNTDDDDIIEEIEDYVTPIYVEENETTNFDMQYANNYCKQLHEIQNEIKETKSDDQKIKFKPPKKIKEENITCKRHCVDDIERFDFNANICVRKINLIEKPYRCPRLKLQRRNCCEKNDIKIQQKLPTYTGLKSEYGLTALQIERRERRKEILRLREQERQRIAEESKRRKIEQNEQIFCDWLKSVSSRKNLNKKQEKIKPILSPNVITFTNKLPEASLMQRPKTAEGNVVKHNIKKKRPVTTSTCIFIEVPHNVLRNGISIGDLLVTKSSNMSSKRLHLLAVS